MTGSEYRRLTLRQMQSRRWVTAKPMKNGNTAIPVGLPVTVVGKRNGLTLRGEPCSSCGVAVYISHVGPGGVSEVAPS